MTLQEVLLTRIAEAEAELDAQELREQIAASIWASGHGIRASWDEISETTRERYRHRTDVLLSGPLARYVRKVQR